MPAIECTRPYPLDDSGSAWVQVIGFTADTFEQGWYGEQDIACPDSVLHSVPQRRAEFFFGRYCARRALLELGGPPAQVAIGRCREPVWPPGILGSISHMACMAGAAVVQGVRHNGVGIDLEAVIDAARHRALRATAVNGHEYRYLQSLDGESLEVWLTIVFSAKESFFKAVYGVVRRHFGFSAVTVAELSPQAGTITLRLEVTLADELRQGSYCQLRYAQPAPGVILTSCLW